MNNSSGPTHSGIYMYVTSQPGGASEPLPGYTDLWPRPLPLSWWDGDIQPKTHRVELGGAFIAYRHRWFSKVWKKSVEYQKILRFFQDVLLNIDTLRVTSCMCLELGSLNCRRDVCNGCDYCKQPMRQLVVFESLVELLKTKFYIDRVFFQDSVFNEQDVWFLESRGFEILHSPGSDNHMTPSTFLFAPSCKLPPLISSIHAAHPSLLVCSDLRIHRWYHRLGQNACIPHAAPLQRQALAGFFSERVMKQLPQSDLADWLRGNFIYYKPLSSQDIVPLEFEFTDEQLFPMVNLDAQLLLRQKRAEGADLGQVICNPRNVRERPEKPEEDNEWPVPPRIEKPMSRIQKDAKALVNWYRKMTGVS